MAGVASDLVGSKLDPSLLLGFCQSWVRICSTKSAFDCDICIYRSNSKGVDRTMRNENSVH